MLKSGIEVAITGVTPIDGYRLRMRFNDGHVSEVDFEPFLQASKHPEIRRFMNHELFSSYRIEWGNLVWGDYDLCFPLESLYENALVESRLQAVAEEHPPYGAGRENRK
jgi:hypothetical protein